MTLTHEERQRSLSLKLVSWADKTTKDVLDLVRRGVMTLPPGTALIPDVVTAQLRVIIGFAIREAALAGQQLQARLHAAEADRAVLREDRPLTGVTATSRRVVSDLRPAEHIVQRFAPVVDGHPKSTARENPAYDEDDSTLPMRRPKPLPDVGDE